MGERAGASMGDVSVRSPSIGSIAVLLTEQ
jgi:hypothetical protein